MMLFEIFMKSLGEFKFYFRPFLGLFDKFRLQISYAYIPNGLNSIVKLNVFISKNYIWWKFNIQIYAGIEG